MSATNRFQQPQDANTSVSLEESSQQRGPPVAKEETVFLLGSPIQLKPSSDHLEHTDPEPDVLSGSTQIIIRKAPKPHDSETLSRKSAHATQQDFQPCTDVNEPSWPLVSPRPCVTPLQQVGKAVNNPSLLKAPKAQVRRDEQWGVPVQSLSP
ncbi:hypothetical protein BDP27DRAFT_1418657 [Rhodocollybia butyracea]|uniref:Uncharacterized protein n=1 Tax=Rhodocollybia butyracea TaxID=206335 RepID=A0A9P5PT48_9AGAR|nr:hypothetical protein BDP27DRAFT_1418657 [Rhodocollybia butyracea]